MLSFVHSSVFNLIKTLSVIFSNNFIFFVTILDSNPNSFTATTLTFTVVPEFKVTNFIPSFDTKVFFGNQFSPSKLYLYPDIPVLSLLPEACIFKLFVPTFTLNSVGIVGLTCAGLKIT